MTGPWQGVYNATVYNTADPLRQNRVQLKIPQVLGTAISAWAIPKGLVQPITVPAVGTAVHAMFSGGEVSHPVYTLATQTPLLFSSYDGQVFEDNPTGWWKLNDPANAVTVQDYSGNNFGGTAANVLFQQPQAVNGVPSASFNGSSSDVVTTYTPTGLTQFTVEIWVNLNNQAQLTSFPQIIADSNTSSTNKGFQLYIPGTGSPIPVINLGNGTTWTSFSFNQALPATGWTYLAVTWDGLTVTTYVNGATASQTAWAGPLAADSAITIGTNVGTSANWFTGLLSEVAIYSTALNYSRILAHFNAKTQGVTGTNIAAGTVVAGIVDGTTITGANIVADGSSGQFLAYNGPPALNNLITAISGAFGADKYGNNFTSGIAVGAVGSAPGSEVALIPNANTPFNITTAISGILQAVAQLSSSDTSQVIPGDLGTVILGTGTAAKMTTALTSPLGTTSAGSGAAVLLEAQNDGNTDTPIITLGTITTPDSSSIVFTPIATFTPYAFLLYGASSGTTIVTKTSGSGTIPIPVGVTVAKGESWGNGNKGGNGNGSSNGGGGGGSGGYSQEPSLVVPSGGTVAYSVSAANSSADTTLTGSATTVTAHPGTAGTTTTNGVGGPASTNTIARAGGRGGFASGQGGAGGGGSAGPGGAGNPGSAGGPIQGGAGGPAVSGGGKGGNGGAPANNGAPGGAPGAGGGAGGSGTGPPLNLAPGNGANGAAGQVRLTYSTGIPPILMSVASAAGTDQFGTTYPAGTVLPTAVWNNITLVNGWTGTARYRILPDGRVELDLLLAAGAATAFQFGTMPVGTRPTAQRNIAAGATTNVGTAEAPFVQILGTGAISMNGLSAFSTASNWVCNGSYPLN